MNYDPCVMNYFQQLNSHRTIMIISYSQYFFDKLRNLIQSQPEQQAINFKFTTRILGEVPLVISPKIITDIWKADESIMKRKYTDAKLYRIGKEYQTLWH